MRRHRTASLRATDKILDNLRSREGIIDTLTHRQSFSRPVEASGITGKAVGSRIFLGHGRYDVARTLRDLVLRAATVGLPYSLGVVRSSARHPA